MKPKSLALLSLPALLFAVPAIAQPTITEYPAPNQRTINRRQLIGDGTAIVERLVDGGFTSAASSALYRTSDYLPEQYADILQSANPYLGQIFRGGNLRLGSVLSSAAPHLSGLFGSDGTFDNYYGQYGGYVRDLLNGNFRTRDLIGVAGRLLSNLFGGSSILGGGRRGTGIDLEQPLRQVYSDPVTSALSDELFFGTSVRGTAIEIPVPPPGTEPPLPGERPGSGGLTGGQRVLLDLPELSRPSNVASSVGPSVSRSARVLRQTGSVLCLHNPICVQSNPTQYQVLLSQATGAMGVANPNQVRGQIAALSRAGVRPDAYTTVFNSEKNAYYVGNKTDTEIARARSEIYLSKEGQAAQKQAIEAAQQTSEALTKMSDECDKNAQASQDLIRCSMKLQTADTAFKAAQIAMDTNEQVDRQLVANILGNIQRGTDGLNKAKDVDRSAMTARLAHEFNVPVTPIYQRR